LHLQAANVNLQEMSSQKPVRRSPRKRPPRREEHSSYRKRSETSAHRKRRPDTGSQQYSRRQRAETKTVKKIEKTFLDEKFELFSEKNNPDVKQKTDIMSDDFDPVAFLYSDVEPPNIEADVRAADCVQMLLAKWDREDGIVTGSE